MGDLMEEILALLTEGDLRCRLAERGGQLPRLRQPMVALQLGEVTMEPAALGGYLGLDEAGAAQFGLLARVLVHLDLYVPHAAGIGAVRQYAQQTLRALQTGLTTAWLQTLDWKEATFNADADCFCCRISLGLLRLCVSVRS